MRFASLGSGSRGNGTLVEHNGTCVLVDCGFSLRETERRLARLKKDASKLAAIVLTHEHGDHVSGVARLARKYALPVWMTAGTWRQRCFGGLAGIQFFGSGQTFEIGALQVCPFPVPHDASEPNQFVFNSGHRRLGLLTDTGCATPRIEHVLVGCDALLLECNHDSEMLAQGRYSSSLKRRVGGDLGHLSNSQAAQLLTKLAHPRLQYVVAMHLSQHNNTPQLARQALGEALACAPDEVAVAGQEYGLGWHSIT